MHQIRTGSPESRLRIFPGVMLLCAMLIAAAPDTTFAALRQDSPTRGAVAPGTQAIATWNAIALETTGSSAFSPPWESRAMAMVSAAVFDAVNSITQHYSPYAARIVANRKASIEAAVCAAAHHVLVALYARAAASLDAARDSALSHVPPGPSRDEGQRVGQAAAAAVIALRAGDRPTSATTYAPAPGMGLWLPTPPAFKGAMEPSWGTLRPFLMDSGSQYRPGPPPPPGSERYVRDYVDVLRVGASSSADRTPMQTESARFWTSTAAPLWNQVVRQVTVAHRFGPSEAARVYLLLNLAGADAFIASWDAKFAYNQWRPVTAIRHTGDDGSPATQADTNWTPLIPTPPFPDYPAGHTSYGGAAEEVLSTLLGESVDGLSISSPAPGGITHHYRSFREISEEVVNARVWAGVHWRTSSTAGRELGRMIGKLALARAPARLTSVTHSR